jgi:hypothetical protein
MKQFVIRAAGFLFVLLCFIAYMFLYPKLYDIVGKFPSLLLFVALIFVCSGVYGYFVSRSKRRKGL